MLGSFETNIGNEWVHFITWGKMRDFLKYRCGNVRHTKQDTCGESTRSGCCKTRQAITPDAY
jgi:hypothetical protein